MRRRTLYSLSPWRTIQIGRGVRVHAEKQRRKARGQIPMDAVQHELPSDIDDLDVARVRFVDRLVRSLVVRDARLEVGDRLVGEEVHVIGRTELRLPDIRFDDLRIVADGFDDTSGMPSSTNRSVTSLRRARVLFVASNTATSPLVSR